MPRYDDRYGNTTRLYVGHLSSRTRARDLEHIFSRYGRVRDVDMKQDFAFVDFGDPRDADDARYSLNGREVDGRRIVVELAKGVPRGPGGVREYIGRGPPPGSGRCFNCGLDGHWARDCKAGDWKNKCYRCGDRGHIERNCKNSPKKLKRGRSYSRSPVRSRSPRRGRGRSRSNSRSRSRSNSRSRSPQARDRVVDRDERRSRSPYSGSPDLKNGGTPSRSRKLSPTPDEAIMRGRESGSPKVVGRLVKDNDEKSQSPGRRSASPVSYEKGGDAGSRRYEDEEGNGITRSPSAGNDRSPIDDVDEGGGGQSP